MKIDYYAYGSGMKSWNNVFKVMLSFATICLVITLNKIFVSLFVVLTMSFLILMAGKIPLKVYFQLMTIPLAFMILSGIIIALQLSLLPVGDWYISLHFFYAGVSKKSIMLAVNVFFKAMAGMSALYMMSLSTPINEFITVLKKLHLPEMLAELMNLIYRYIFILFDVAVQMQTAARARLGYVNFYRSCKSFAGIAGNLFLIALKKAGTYYDAMVSRGYDGTMDFLTEDKPLKLWQIFGSVLYFLIMIFIAIIE